MDQVLEAGRRSPSSRNWQPWDFIVVTGPQRLADLSRVSPGAGYVGGAAAAIALIALGYPADRPLTPVVRPDRHPFEEIVHREHW